MAKAREKEFMCLRDCYHNHKLFKADTVYARKVLGPGAVPHHFRGMNDLRLEADAIEASEIADLDGADSYDPLEEG